MQEKESRMVVRCRLKILSLGITVRHHSANSYPPDRIFSPHLTTIKDSDFLSMIEIERKELFNWPLLICFSPMSLYLGVWNTYI